MTVQSISLRAGEMNPKKFFPWIEKITQVQGPNILRLKGILAFGSATLLQLTNAHKEAKNKPVPLVKEAKQKRPAEKPAAELYKFEKVCSVTKDKPKELK